MRVTLGGKPVKFSKKMILNEEDKPDHMRSTFQVGHSNGSTLDKKRDDYNSSQNSWNTTKMRKTGAWL